VAAGSALALPVPDASVDLIVTLDVLQHLPLDGGDGVALREMRRALRPGGLLFARTNAQSVPRVVDDPEYNFRKYDAADLRAKLGHAGFAVRRLGRLNALLGLAEIPRELRARRLEGAGYHGLLTAPAAPGGLGPALRRQWLSLEGRFVEAGGSLPLGRTLLALCEAT
jgi:SAM-dependent methyltransferase